MSDHHNIFQHLLSSPSNFKRLPSDLKEALFKRFFDLLIPSTMLLSFFSVLVTLFPVFYGSRLIIGALGCCVTLSLYLAKKKLLYTQAMRMFIVLSALVLSIATLFNGGVQAPAFVAFGNLLIIMGCLYDMRMSYITFCGILVLSLLSHFLIKVNILPDPSPPTRSIYLMIYSFLFFIAVSTVGLNTQLLTSSLVKTLEQKSLLTSMFSSLNESVLLIDDHLTSIQSNHKADLLEKWCQTHLKYSLFKVPIQQETRTTSLATFIRNKHFRIKNELISISTSNGDYFFEITCTPLQQMSSPSYLLLIREVSELIQHRTHLHHVEKMNALGQLASGMAHDFNNLLSGIEGAVDALQTPTLNEQNTPINIIKETVQTASILTEQLMTYGRTLPEHMDWVDVNQSIQKMIHLLKHTLDKKTEIEVDFEGESIWIHVNEALFQNSLVNLAINSSQAMPHGGKLIFRTKKVHLTGDELLKIDSSQRIHNHPGEYILIEIEDEGEGISEEIKDRIFEPFFSTKHNQSGTGLGLVAVHSLIQSHKGILSVESYINQGTCFRLYFPYSPPPDLNKQIPSKSHKELTHQLQESSRSLQEQNQQNPLHILLVEDDEILRELMSQKLSSLGFKMTQAYNGKKALEYIHQSHFDLIILDLIMPVMNGEETFQVIQTLSNPPPIILVSGGLISSSLTKDIDAETVYSLKKPYRSDELVKLISHILGNSS